MVCPNPVLPVPPAHECWQSSAGAAGPAVPGDSTATAAAPPKSACAASWGGDRAEKPRAHFGKCQAPCGIQGFTRNAAGRGVTAHWGSPSPTSAVRTAGKGSSALLWEIPDLQYSRKHRQLSHRSGRTLRFHGIPESQDDLECKGR